MHGHLLALSQLLQHAGEPPDLDAPNSAGLSVRGILSLKDEAAAGGKRVGGSGGGSGSGSGTGGSSTGSSSSSGGGGRGPPWPGAPSGPGATAAMAAAAAAARDADWRARLAEEMSDDDGGWGSVPGARWGAASGRPAADAEWGGAAAAAAPGSAAAAAGEDDDDDNEWADRLWRDMQEHRRRTQAAAARSAGAGPSGGGGAAARDAADKERRRRAAAAAAESDRILKEERAKDADWRAAMMRQIEQAAMPSRRAEYDEKWAALERWPAGRPITYADVPWPPCQGPRAAAAAAAAPGAQAELRLDPQQLRALVLGGATGPQEVKMALRRELLRFHPDKFQARFATRLAPEHKEAILAGVHAVAQQLTALKQG